MSDKNIQYFKDNFDNYDTTMAQWVRETIPIEPSLHYLFYIWACRAGFIDIVQMIPLDPSIDFIRQAALYGHDDIVQWLLLDPSVNDSEGITVKRILTELNDLLEK